MVKDVTKPTISGLGTQYKNLDGNCTTTLDDYTTKVNAADNCGSMQISLVIVFVIPQEFWAYNDTVYVPEAV